jgi:DNA replication protein DnaC
MTGQMALNLPVRVDFSAETFVEGRANADAVAALARWSDWPRAAMALVGPVGAGKSHLAAIWARDVTARITNAAGLETCLASLPAGCCLVVEDVDENMPEAALFHAINRAAEGDIPCCGAPACPIWSRACALCPMSNCASPMTSC